MFNKITTRIIKTTLPLYRIKSIPIPLIYLTKIKIINLNKFMFCTKAPTLKPKTEEVGEEGNLFL